MSTRFSKLFLSLVMGTALVISAIPSAQAAPLRPAVGRNIKGILIGRVVVGPYCTATSFSDPGFAPSCTYLPYGSARLNITNQNGQRQVITTRTNRQGYFLVHLKPGEYVISNTESPSGSRNITNSSEVDYHGFSQAAIVLPGQSTYVDITYNYLAK